MRILMLVFVALLASGCTYEWRGGELWACGTVETSVGPMYGCQPTGVRVTY